MRNSRYTKLIRLFAVALAMLCCLLLAGCTTFESFRHTFLDENAETSTENNTIYIGVYEPESGEFANAGKDQIKGIELAKSIYDNVLGYDIELIYVDTQSDAKASKSAIQSLVKMKPVAIIGAAGEAASLIAAEYINEAKIPTITPSAVNPLITSESGYYFRACLTESQGGAGLAEYAANSIKSKGIAVVSIKNDSTIGAVLDGFKDNLKAINSESCQISTEIPVTVTEDNWTSTIKQIKKSGADTVFLPFGAEKADAFFTAAEKKGLTDITYIGPSSWGTPKFAAMLDNHPDIKVAFPYSSVISEDRSTTGTLTFETQRFIIEYKNMYGEQDLPSQNAALGYDSYLLLINAIYKANSLDGTDIRDAMYSLNNLQCATGAFSFDASGNTVRKVNIATIKDGLIVFDYTTSGDSSAVVSSNGTKG